eukprot:TRINITY_DN4788_c0_g1_i5.p1 TRINITY_DN4788_c0_g1~~TRINITY_DN4788_c0_g1_i5.p1  ORF type:complete len:613 (+),score=79.74 TRINITY_DN4788_c0_g1_i5:113-1951(+)
MCIRDSSLIELLQHWQAAAHKGKRTLRRKKSGNKYLSPSAERSTCNMEVVRFKSHDGRPMFEVLVRPGHLERFRAGQLDWRECVACEDIFRVQRDKINKNGQERPRASLKELAKVFGAGHVGKAPRTLLPYCMETILHEGEGDASRKPLGNNTAVEGWTPPEEDAPGSFRRASSQDICAEEVVFVYSDASVWYADQALSYAWVDGGSDPDVFAPQRSGGCALVACEDANSARAEAYGVAVAMEELWSTRRDCRVEHRCDCQGNAHLFQSLGDRPLSSWSSTADAGLWWMIWWYKQKWSGRYKVLWVRSHIEKRKEHHDSWSRHERGNFYVDQLADDLLAAGPSARAVESTTVLRGDACLAQLGLVDAFELFAEEASGVSTVPQLARMIRAWVTTPTLEVTQLINVPWRCPEGEVTDRSSGSEVRRAGLLCVAAHFDSDQNKMKSPHVAEIAQFLWDWFVVRCRICDSLDDSSRFSTFVDLVASQSRKSNQELQAIEERETRKENARQQHRAREAAALRNAGLRKAELRHQRGWPDLGAFSRLSLCQSLMETVLCDYCVERWGCDMGKLSQTCSAFRHCLTEGCAVESVPFQNWAHSACPPTLCDEACTQTTV